VLIGSVRGQEKKSLLVVKINGRVAMRSAEEGGGKYDTVIVKKKKTTAFRLVLRMEEMEKGKEGGFGGGGKTGKKTQGRTLSRFPKTWAK